GRLVLLEAVFARKDLAVRARDAMSWVFRKAGQDTDHHGPYDADLIESLPLAHARSLEPILDAVRDAGWSNVRAERLRDIERARRRQLGFLRGWLRHVRRYAILADA